MKRWFDVLIKKVQQSYSPRIIVIDLDQLGSDQLFRESLSQDFAVVCFQGELALRQFIRQHKNQQILILIQQEGLYVPFDIEQSSDLISWTLADVFPRLDSKTLRKFEIEGYQSIFNAYQEVADNLTIQGEMQTLILIRKWMAAGKVWAAEKGYGGVPYVKGPSDGLRETGNAEIECTQLVEEIQLLLKQDKTDWLTIAQRWGRLEYLRPAEILGSDSYWQLDHEIGQRFHDFIYREYDHLFFSSYKAGPVTINQTLSYLSTLAYERIALLCFDGMGFPEWYGLKEYLQANGIWSFREGSTFALIPTLTSSSRTSLFTGEILLDKMGSESAGYVKAVNRLFPGGRNATKQLFKNTDGKWNRDYLSYNVLGIIFDIIDTVGHKSILLSKSKKNMHNQLQELYGQTQIALTISSLLKEGYRVFITSDHGSVWCYGNGIRADKYLVEERALRVLVYPNKELAAEFAAKNNLILFQNQRLLSGKALVLPMGREMFSLQDKLSISHGGIHIEEVVIPFVEVLS